MEEQIPEVQELEIESIIGFDGNAVNGVQVHPDGMHIVYPLGNKLVVQNLKTKTQSFLEGHTNVISTVAMSKSGKFIASGQINHMGFKASIIVWDFEQRKDIFKSEGHKVRVQCVIFSSCENYVYSLGGPDDCNILAWSIERKEVICGSFSSSRIAGDALTLCATNLRGECFLSGGESNLKIWVLDAQARNFKSRDVLLGKIKRNITCMQVDSKDEYAYCGTSTGDLIKIKLNFPQDMNQLEPLSNPVLVGCYGKIPKKQRRPMEKAPEAKRWSLGVRALLLTDNNRIIIGAGDGAVELVEEVPDSKKGAEQYKIQSRLITPSLPKLSKVVNIDGMVSSIQRLDQNNLIVGTMKCELFLINIQTSKKQLLLTCHTSAVYDLVFPRDYSQVFATASKDDIRVWNIETSRELLRISVPNFTCSGIVFSYDGKSIITSWNDGTIKAFTPQTGTLIYTILNAHNKGVSAVAITSDGKKIVSGGGEGQVRVWEIKPNKQSLLAVLKEHKGPVSSIDINRNDKEVVTASSDGTCIIWDLERYARTAILFSSTLFMCVRYHPTGCQVVTCGTNRQIGYWEVYDGSLIREIEGSASSALNTLDLTDDGNYFATGGTDQILKVWKYREGLTTHVGVGHAGVITSVRFSPDRKRIVSTSADGAIFIWACPLPRDQPQPAAKVTSSRGSLLDRPLGSRANSIETIKEISPSQSVRATSRHEGSDSPASASNFENGVVKCYCKEKCNCISEKANLTAQCNSESSGSDHRSEANEKRQSIDSSSSGSKKSSSVGNICYGKK
ncbi:hypothetical protein LSTR_LSTR009723 [Laodelphax striatellus]|uniref:Cilia- and flagella-associated protein 52 n=1 Tax=Laodelphax striatellus TaxID=195883 RepID=A0A482WVQ9_LAOST|nr:hypothetical protein LSTR_LSTR009723 [Laodelphax striatellus]